MARPVRPLSQTRECALLVAAVGAFTRDGYEAASLNQIIAESGWSKSSFYHYFDDKQALYDHLVRKLIESAIEQLPLPALDDLCRASFWPQLVELAQGLDDCPTETALLVQLVLREDSDPSGTGEIAELRARVREWLHQAMAHGQQIGMVRTDLPVGLVAELARAALVTLLEWNRAAAPGEQRSASVAAELLRASTSHPGCPCRGCPRSCDL